MALRQLARGAACVIFVLTYSRMQIYRFVRDVGQMSSERQHPAFPTAITLFLPDAAISP